MGHKWTIILTYAFIYFVLLFKKEERRRVGSAFTLTDLIVETVEGETEGSQELGQDSIAGQRGHAVN